MPNDEIHPTNRSVRRVVPSGPLGALNVSLKSGRDLVADALGPRIGGTARQV